jgi:RNA polymerase sigma-70 factor, ECF subfamily
MLRVEARASAREQNSALTRRCAASRADARPQQNQHTRSAQRVLVRPVSDGTLHVVVRARADRGDGEDTSSSEALMERAQAGDSAAFGALYDRFSGLLLAAALRLLSGRRAEASDLVHDVFLEAWQHVRSYDVARGTVRTWLLLRLRSRAFDLRARAVTRYTELVGGHEGFAESAAPAHAHGAELLAIRSVLAELEPGIRAVLDQTYFEGLTAREIAERSGLPLGTVKSRLARGLSALEAALTERGEHA